MSECPGKADEKWTRASEWVSARERTCSRASERKTTEQMNNSAAARQITQPFLHVCSLSLSLSRSHTRGAHRQRACARACFDLWQINQADIMCARKWVWVRAALSLSLSPCVTLCVCVCACGGEMLLLLATKWVTKQNVVGQASSSSFCSSHVLIVVIIVIVFIVAVVY